MLAKISKILKIPAIPLLDSPPKKTSAAVTIIITPAASVSGTLKIPATRCSAVSVLATILKKIPAQALSVASHPAGLP